MKYNDAEGSFGQLQGFVRKMSDPTPIISSWHIRLRRILVDYFSEDELRTLCFDLRVDYDDLRGSNKTKKVVNLISHLARLERMEELIDLSQAARPNAPWEDLRTAALQNPLLVDEEPDEATGTTSKPASQSRLFTGKQRDRLLFGIVMALLAVLLTAGVGTLLIRAALDTSQPEAARAQTVPTTVTNTTTPTAVAPANILLSEDFESGQASQWRDSSPNQYPQVIGLPDGNNALQIKNGIEALYAPAWDWDKVNYRFEADVMVHDLTPTTSIGLHARVVSPGDVGYCQGYRAEIGPGHAAIHLITTSSCHSPWQYTPLNTDLFELKADTWHRLRLDVSGNRLRFYIDGILTLVTTDKENNYMDGGIGLIVFDSEEAYVDNVTVTALSPVQGQ